MLNCFQSAGSMLSDINFAINHGSAGDAVCLEQPQGVDATLTYRTYLIVTSVLGTLPNYGKYRTTSTISTERLRLVTYQICINFS